jgi:hypothetical protein
MPFGFEIICVQLAAQKLVAIVVVIGKLGRVLRTVRTYRYVTNGCWEHEVTHQPIGLACPHGSAASSADKIGAKIEMGLSRIKVVLLQ